MKIIRDDEGLGLMMIPLFVDWNVRRCNVEGCTIMPTTIITQLGDAVPIVGMCEKHFQEGRKPGGATFTFEWDDFDAFKKKEQRDV